MEDVEWWAFWRLQGSTMVTSKSALEVPREAPKKPHKNDSLPQFKSFTSSTLHPIN
jgi:hypothetical protein